jgi:hypothetical protein
MLPESRMFRKFVAPALGVLIGIFCAVYIIDTLVARIRLARNPASALGTVTVYQGAALKGNKFAIYGGEPDTVTCVHAWFGHFGYPSCWYEQGESVNIH